MIYSKIQESLSLLLSVQYTHTQHAVYDYSQQPRPCYNFVFMLEGEGRIQANGEEFQIKKGDILFIPKNTTYKSTWLPNPKVVFHSLHFSFQAQSDPFLDMDIPVQLLGNEHFYALYALLKEIKQYQFCKNTNLFLALSAFYRICGELLQNIQYSASRSVSKTLTPAITYIEQNYAKPFTVEYLADLCFLSPSRFYYLFKQQTGVSPIVYKNKIAIQSCMQELLYNKDLSIKEIAEKHGFPSVIYFERLFKKQTGKTPSQYRKQELFL